MAEDILRKIATVTSPAFAIIQHFFPPPIGTAPTPENIIPEIPTDPTDPKLAQRFLFSPFTIPDETQLQQLIILLGIAKLSKTSEGLKVLQAVGVQYLKTLGTTLQALESSSSSNWLTAIVNQKLSLRVMRTLGLLSATEAANLEADYNYIFHVTIAKEGIVEGLAAAGTLARALT